MVKTSKINRAESHLRESGRDPAAATQLHNIHPKRGLRTGLDCVLVEANSSKSHPAPEYFITFPARDREFNTP